MVNYIVTRIFSEDKGMFHKKVQKETYDRENQKTVIRSSICTSEKVAGFRDLN